MAAGAGLGGLVGLVHGALVGAVLLSSLDNLVAVGS
jgi:hypothetical protein